MEEINTENSYAPAPISDRMIAFFIDFLPFFVAPAVILWASVNIFNIFSITLNQMAIVITASNFLFLAYAAVFNSGGRVTVGKWLMGIKVAGKNGGDINIIKGVLRAAGYYAGLVTFFATFAIAYVTKNRRALQDYLAGSVVVSVREKTRAEATATMFISAVLSGALIALTVFYLFKAQPSSQKDIVLNARMQLNKIAYLEEVHKKQYGFYTDDLIRLALISGDPVQFQRDMQANLRRRGFRIGVSPDRYKITGMAKDLRNTKVTFES